MDLHDLRVLLVEPSQVQQRIISGQLENLGVASTVRVQSSEGAFKALRENAPDVVLSAMHLSDTTGACLLEDLRKSDLHRDLPFVLVSSEQGDRYLEPVKQGGVTAIIRKPCKEADLHMALLRTLDLIEPNAVDLGPRALNHLQVLVVDDSRTARRWVMRVLGNLGLQHFTEAEDGIDGQQQFLRSNFDLVVTDYNMPRLDGQGLLRWIRNESLRPHTPVLMVTTEQNESRLSAVSQLGVNALCDKPFEPQVVRRLIAGIVSAHDEN